VTAPLEALLSNLIVAPILLPLLTAALMLLLGEPRRGLKAAVNVLSCALGLAVSVALLLWVDSHDAAGAVGVYLPSNWEVPFGIVLAVDRLSALMLVLASGIGLAAVLFAVARWDRAGIHFHPLFQIQLMGLNGAFLTADLFNLFVFFEVLLAASYGLLLHGSGRARVSAGLHYIAVNLLASSLFLIGVAVLYGATGTLNMADLAQKIPLVEEENRGLMHAGAAILAIAFLAKAAMWPLNFWLAPAYAAAGAPVAALFALMTKVGVYAVLRLWTLLFSGGAGASALFGGDALVAGGLATLAFGAVGVMASQHLGRLAGFCIIVSSGTLLAAIGFGRAALTSGAMFYLLSSSLALAALFLLNELIERSRQIEEDVRLPDDEGDSPPFAAALLTHPDNTNLDDEQVALIGKVIPAAMAFLGLSFIACTLLIAGLPPLSGFIGKLGILAALLDPMGLGGPSAAAPMTPAAWGLFVLLIASGLASLLALMRAGIRFFWAPQDRPVPRLRIIECLPIAALVGACIVLSVRAEPAMNYMRAAAEALHQPAQYIATVMSARPVPAPARGGESLQEGAQ
jgi:multicomponent K+:H+ antiporter subunit D